MSFYGEDNDLRWGIVTLRSNLGRGHNQQLQIVVDGGVSPEVIVRLNDVIWHHLCMTWNRTGDWQFFMDGRKVSKGKQLGVIDVMVARYALMVTIVVMVAGGG